jgi:phosphate uptake regulator
MSQSKYSVRRIQKIKGGSYIISIPPDWVRKNSLDIKSEVVVIDNSEWLLIRPFRRFNDVKEILFTDLETVEYLVSVYYMQGASTIIIKGDKIIPPEAKVKLKALQLELPGLEVEEEEFDKISFKVNYPTNYDVSNSTISFSNKVISLFSDLRKVLISKNVSMAEDIKLRAEDLMKRYKAVIREISLSIQSGFLPVPFKDMILYAIAMRDLGRVLHHIKVCASLIMQCNTISKEIIESSGLIEELLKKSFNVFETENISQVTEIRRNVKVISQNLEKIKDDTCNTELAKEFNRILTYVIAIMDDGVHKSVRI